MARFVYLGYTVRPVLPPAVDPDPDAEVAEGAAVDAAPPEPGPRAPFAWAIQSAMLSDPKQESICLARADNPNVAATIAIWLQQQFPVLAARDPFAAARPDPDPIVLVGFDVDLFLRILAADCACSTPGFALPPGLWMGWRTFDLWPWLKGITPHMLQRVHMLPVDAAEWAARVSRWPGPGANAQEDNWLAHHVSVFLGLRNESKK